MKLTNWLLVRRYNRFQDRRFYDPMRHKLMPRLFPAFGRTVGFFQRVDDMTFLICRVDGELLFIHSKDRLKIPFSEILKAEMELKGEVRQFILSTKSAQKICVQYSFHDFDINLFWSEDDEDKDFFVWCCTIANSQDKQKRVLQVNQARF